MRAVSSSSDVNGRRNIEQIRRIQRAKKVTEAEKKERTTSVGYYEERGMTKENKETGSTTTPQAEYRKQIAQMAKSPIYEKLQNQATKNKEDKTNEPEVEQKENYER